MFGGLTHTQNLIAGLAIMTGVVSTQAHAELSPQDRLDAIRQSLIEASLETPTRVQTTTWIDGQGSLRESSSFKNGMEVRGVRVISYDRDDTGQPKARLQYPSATLEQPLQRPEGNLIKGTLNKINKALNKVSEFAKDMAPKAMVDAAVAPSCHVKVGGKLRHVMSLNLQIDPGTNSVFLSAFSPLIQSFWIGNAGTMNTPNGMNVWQMVNPLPAASMSKTLTSYERALISNRPDKLPWSASLHVRTEQLEAAGWSGIRGEKGNSMIAHLNLQVTGAEGQNLGYEVSTSIPLVIETASWSAPKINMSSIASLQKELQIMRSNAEEWLACQPINPVVTAVYSQQVEINAGALAGVQKGDEWLLANPARFPTELLSKEGAPQTLLARVQSVTPFNAQLVVLAGPTQSAQTDWRAWPTESLTKDAIASSKVNPVGSVKSPNKSASHVAPNVSVASF